MAAPFLLCCWIPPDSLLSHERQFFATNTVHPVNGYKLGNPPLLGYGDDEFSTAHYEPHSQEKVWHNRTELADVRNGRTHWKTVFSQVRQFQNYRPDVFDLLSIMIRVSQWEVVWSCKIDNQAQFADLEYESMMQSRNPYVEPLLDIHGMHTSEAWKNAI